MDDQALHTQIESLVAEEHRLLDTESAMSEGDRKRLGEVNVQLDRLWDLLRQRRARAEFNGDVKGEEAERSAKTVESYLQ